MNTGETLEQVPKDDCLKLLERIRDNANLVRTNKRTSSRGAQFAAALEAEFETRIADYLKALSHVEQSAAPAAQPMERAA